MPYLPSHRVQSILVIAGRIQAIPRRGRIADDGNTPFPRGVHGEFVYHHSVGDGGSPCVGSNHAEPPDESVVGEVNQVTVPRPLHRKHVVRYDGDWEDLLSAAGDGAKVVVIVTVVGVGVAISVIVVRSDGAGRTRMGRREDVVGAHELDARLGGRLKGCICVHEPECRRLRDGIHDCVTDGGKPYRSRVTREYLVSETELADDRSVTVREAVRHRVAVWYRVRNLIGVDVWKGKCLDDLDLADITMDEVGAVEHEDVGP